MQANPDELPIKDKELVGRRLHNCKSEPELVFEGDTARFTANAFIEDRVGEHVSADAMWVTGTTAVKEINWITKRLDSIATAEGAKDLVGWAACEAGSVRTAAAIEDVVRTKQPSNPRHVDIQKLSMLVVQAEDDPKTRRKKTLLVAQSLRDCFNTAGQFIAKPTAPATESPPAVAQTEQEQVPAKLQAAPDDQGQQT